MFTMTLTLTFYAYTCSTGTNTVKFSKLTYLPACLDDGWLVGAGGYEEGLQPVALLLLHPLLLTTTTPTQS